MVMAPPTVSTGEVVVLAEAFPGIGACHVFVGVQPGEIEANTRASINVRVEPDRLVVVDRERPTLNTTLQTLQQPCPWALVPSLTQSNAGGVENGLFAHFRLRLSGGGGSGASSPLRDEPDWSSADAYALRAAGARLTCGACGSHLQAGSGIFAKYLALPSDGWEELCAFLSCHGWSHDLAHVPEQHTFRLPLTILLVWLGELAHSGASIGARRGHCLVGETDVLIHPNDVMLDRVLRSPSAALVRNRLDQETSCSQCCKASTIQAIVVIYFSSQLSRARHVMEYVSFSWWSSEKNGIGQ